MLNLYKESQVILSTCPKCGGNCEYNPTYKNLKCSLCGSIRKIKATNDNLVPILLKDTLSKGAEDELNSGVGIKPQGILTFNLGHNDAINYLEQWFENEPKAPKDLHKNYRNLEIDGLYIPFWSFSAKTLSHYSYEIGEYSYDESKEPGLEKLDFIREHGECEDLFRDVLVCAIMQPRCFWIEEGSYYDMSKLEDFNSKYLSGFRAQMYTKTAEEGFTRAKLLMKRLVGDALQDNNSISFRNLNLDIEFSDITYMHILLPIYSINYTYKGRKYYAIVNGQTGEIRGKVPTRPIKSFLEELINT